MLSALPEQQGDQNAMRSSFFKQKNLLPIWKTL
jgi:hypothetical protein